MSFGQSRRDSAKELDTFSRENDVKSDYDTDAEIVRLKEAEPQNTDYSQEVKGRFQNGCLRTTACAFKL